MSAPTPTNSSGEPAAPVVPAPVVPSGTYAAATSAPLDAGRTDDPPRPAPPRSVWLRRVAPLAAAFLLAAIAAWPVERRVPVRAVLQTDGSLVIRVTTAGRPVRWLASVGETLEPGKALLIWEPRSVGTAPAPTGGSVATGGRADDPHRSADAWESVPAEALDQDSLNRRIERLGRVLGSLDAAIGKALRGTAGGWPAGEVSAGIAPALFIPARQAADLARQDALRERDRRTVRIPDDLPRDRRWRLLWAGGKPSDDAIDSERPAGGTGSAPPAPARWMDRDEPLAELGDRRSVVVSVRLPSEHAAKATAGTVLELRLDLHPDVTMKAVVMRVSATPDREGRYLAAAEVQYPNLFVLDALAMRELEALGVPDRARDALAPVFGQAVGPEKLQTLLAEHLGPQETGRVLPVVMRRGAEGAERAGVVPQALPGMVGEAYLPAGKRSLLWALLGA